MSSLSTALLISDNGSLSYMFELYITDVLTFLKINIIYKHNV